MSKNKIPSQALPAPVDSIETLLDFIAADTFYPFPINSSPSKEQFDQTTIEKIYRDLTSMKDFIDAECALLLHLNDKTTDGWNTNSHQTISDSCTFDGCKLSSNSATPATSDVDDEDFFDSQEWIISQSLIRKPRPPKLHEFLRLLLNNPRYSSYASWLSRDEGLFKIHKPDEVVRMWEKVKMRKTRLSMDYQNFSRGIRCYYKSGLMIKTNTKHTYCFAEKNQSRKNASLLSVQRLDLKY